LVSHWTEDLATNCLGLGREDDSDSFDVEDSGRSKIEVEFSAGLDLVQVRGDIVQAEGDMEEVVVLQKDESIGYQYEELLRKELGVEDFHFVNAKMASSVPGSLERTHDSELAETPWRKLL